LNISSEYVIGYEQNLISVIKSILTIYETIKFTVVGYGAMLAWPPPLMINSDFKRRYAESEYRALLPAWLRLSQNHATDDEGTCFGDSGGPAFYTDSAENRIIVGTISWGDPNCISTGFNYRTDITETMEFIEGVINYAENVQQ